MSLLGHSWCRYCSTFTFKISQNFCDFWLISDVVVREEALYCLSSLVLAIREVPVGVGSVMVQSRADVSNGQFYVTVARALAEEHQRTAGCCRTREEGLTTDTFLITLAITISIC